MRAGACAAQQTLTAEAASVLKHSLSLARRRGHAQVTPLHVAATLLSPRASLLKRACLKTQPHQSLQYPLHCRALELCFNVALNRLPTTPAPLFHAQPSLSNALIAALKRAQAHQRRGCVDHQQQQQNQPILAIKVEIEQLILSILDDPSVSRVMREAGFSSTTVKRNLEDFSSPSSVFQCYSSSGGVYSSPCSPSPSLSPPETHREVINPKSFWQTHFLTCNSDPNPHFFSHQKEELLSSNPLTDLTSVKEDIKLVFEVLLRKKRRNPVILGDSANITEGLVSQLMDRIKKGGFPDELKPAHFIKFQFSTVPLRFMKREEVEVNLSELKRKVDSLASGGGGVIIYTGDLKWTIDAAACEKGEGFSNGEISCYNPVDHLVADIGKLLSDYRTSNTKVWLMATANYQTYMRCQMKQPSSLEVQWSLQAVSLPSGGLGLSLHATSVHDSSQVPETKPFCGKEEQDKLTCCTECTSKYEIEAGLMKSSQQKPSLYINPNCNTRDMEKGSTQLPHWLQSQSTEMQKDDLVELSRKWNRMCHEQHPGRHIQKHTGSFLNNQSLSGKSYTYKSSPPWWATRNSIFPDSNSLSFTHSTSNPIHPAGSLPQFRRQQSCHIEFSFSNENNKHQSAEPNLVSLKNTEGKDVKITLALGNSQFSENGKSLGERKSDMCKKLQENLPWQLETIPSIVESLVESKLANKQTWLLIQGNDSIGKRRLARGIAESVFGSADFLLHMNMRKSEDKMSLCCGTLERALRDHEKLLVLVEDVDFADTQFIKFLADGFETGKFGESSENGGNSRKAEIFILTKGDSTSCGDAKNLNSVIQINLEVSETIPNSGTPNSDNKRKAELELPNKAKNPKTDGKENTCSIGTECGKAKKEFTRQSSSNTLDLNMEADERDDEKEAKEGDFSPVSSDLTRETRSGLLSQHGFLELIGNRFVLNRGSTRDSLIKEMVWSRIEGSFEEVFGSEGPLSCLFGGVEEKLLEELLVGFGSFLNNLFDKWLKEVFQKSLEMVRIGGKEEGVRSVRVCLGSKEISGLESSNGFMGSKLPKKIQVSFMG